MFDDGVGDTGVLGREGPGEITILSGFKAQFPPPWFCHF